MKIKEGFILRKVGERSVVVPTGEASKHFHGMINLNDTGAFLWTMLNNEVTETQMLEAILIEYDVSREKAEQSLYSFLDKIKSAGILDVRIK